MRGSLLIPFLRPELIEVVVNMAAGAFRPAEWAVAVSNAASVAHLTHMGRGSNSLIVDVIVLFASIDGSWLGYHP